MIMPGEAVLFEKVLLILRTQAATGSRDDNFNFPAVSSRERLHPDFAAPRSGGQGVDQEIGQDAIQGRLIHHDGGKAWRRRGHQVDPLVQGQRPEMFKKALVYK